MQYVENISTDWLLLFKQNLNRRKCWWFILGTAGRCALLNVAVKGESFIRPVPRPELGDTNFSVLRYILSFDHAIGSLPVPCRADESE